MRGRSGPIKASALDECLVLGLDVGGTKIAAGLVQFPSGEILKQTVIPTNARLGGLQVLRSCVSLAEQWYAQDRFRGIGIGLAELVDLEGRPASAHSIDWRNISLQEAFANVAPVCLDSDVRAASLAEAIYGYGRDYPWFIYISIGTGISYTLVRDGEPYAGSRGNALIFASSPLTTTCSQCGFVSRVILEEYAAGPGLIRRYNEAGGNAIHGENVLGAAANGDVAALQVINSAAKLLGTQVAFLINALDPQAVIVGGGLGVAPGLYWETLLSSTREHVWAPETRSLPVMQSHLGLDAGLVGAAIKAALRVNR